ncbi:ankyrin repeat and SOCS box protein 1-like isoform X2 [Saccostrea echinata]|uniref:ankyrin repeat and SOCS box protein 1-like isoform X2 n=1 Tax=Saccostrea echinata TaxID=191078 RepID=UPI002A7EDAAD|nr:ankyrin repeat and SOCS box protein 1-like isoform X2 [Saccostrea echinata]
MSTDFCTTPSVVQSAKDGDIEEVYKLIQNGADVNSVNYLGQTALHMAATVLIDAGAELEVTDRKGQTALYKAVFNLHISTASLLLKTGADPEGSPKNISTPLHIAVMHKNVDILQLLLEYNAAVHFSNGRVCAVDFLLSTTVDNRVCFDLIKSLLQHGCEIDYNHVTRQTMTMSPLFACIFYLKPAAILVMLYEFGCGRWNFNWRDDCLYDRREDKEFVKDFIREKAASPRSLVSACRVFVYQCLQRKPLLYINHLPLPKTMKDYLAFSDVVYF